jgi:hypothetical protein
MLRDVDTQVANRSDGMEKSLPSMCKYGVIVSLCLHVFSGRRRAQDDAKALMAGVVGKFKQNKVRQDAASDNGTQPLLSLGTAV